MMALNTRLFVGNLPENFNEHALKDIFSSYGEITNFDLKCKPGLETDNTKKFAFVTITTSNYNLESCIKYFSNKDFQGQKLYVTRARESFLERLQREREQSKNKSEEKEQEVLLPCKIKLNGEHHNNKRKFHDGDINDSKYIKKSKTKPAKVQQGESTKPVPNETNNNCNENQDSEALNSNQSKKYENKNKQFDNSFQNNEKKQLSDKKRQESMKKKRQDFNEKRNIIKTGLVSIDKQSNKKIIFSDNEENSTLQETATTNGDTNQSNNKLNLFDDGDSDNEINFEVKKQFEGKKGQKALDLQSRYKSDKRFVLDERFVDGSESEKEDGENVQEEDIELNQADEKSKQLNILQDLLGVPIKSKLTDTTNKTKTKMGMLRFDPSQPEHAKYLVPITTEEHPKKSKKKKNKESKDEEVQKEPEPIVEKVEVSKEQFYKISDTLKETMTQPTTFSLRSLFNKEEDDNQQDNTEEVKYISLQAKKQSKVKNPLEPSEKNPFQYDSSESENEDDNTDNLKPAEETNDVKTVWREKLFFSVTDHRLKDGLTFFTNPYEYEGKKDRRELKYLMKKRMYNKERKNTMFLKKIGGKPKNIRKNFKRN